MEFHTRGTMKGLLFMTICDTESTATVPLRQCGLTRRPLHRAPGRVTSVRRGASEAEPAARSRIRRAGDAGTVRTVCVCVCVCGLLHRVRLATPWQDQPSGARCEASPSKGPYSLLSHSSGGPSPFPRDVRPSVYT